VKGLIADTDLIPLHPKAWWRLHPCKHVKPSRWRKPPTTGSNHLPKE